MRPPRLILLLLCFIFLPVVLTTLSHLSAHPQPGDSGDSAVSRTSRLRALFSFHAPSSLFPPSAIISLTDDNSTFFLARPAAFGPLLPSNGLSAPLWIGSGFSDDSLRKGGIRTGSEGELGCSDVPGWDDADRSQKDSYGNEKLKTGEAKDVVINTKRSNDKLYPDVASAPSEDDGTDDYLHLPLPESDASRSRDNRGLNNNVVTHADIQSLQESAEIAGKVVLLSRGGCGFLEKVKWAQRRGAVAVIVGDDTRGGGLVTMYARGDTSNVTIPSVFTSYTTAHLLSSLIPPEHIDSGKSSQSAQSSNTQNKKSRRDDKSTTAIVSSCQPTATSTSRAGETGVLRSVLSALGIASDSSSFRSLHEDSRRPPSSGNIDWVMMDFSDEEETANSPNRANSKNKSPLSRESTDIESQEFQGDDFVIGVQDWRDPDLVAHQRSVSTSNPTATSVYAGVKTNSPANSPNSGENRLKGGSITPGSGEYPSNGEQLQGKWISHDEQPATPSKPESVSGKRSGHWWFYPFGWGDEEEDDSFGPSATTTAKPVITTQKSTSNLKIQAEHEGLWVTLTPTNMSASPFFDTLLVLVVSPLVTLTVVYALLLLRSRVRQRRWRAPKAIVDRLPVRTYHTISSRSPTPPTRSPGSSEKRSPRAPVSRRKYRGRQVECVVCLEEYVDGQSRVMSLPCGHEFHAECITPWLTTRRRTCPICKGDVVRSLGRSPDLDEDEQTFDEMQSHIAETHNDTPSAAYPLPENTEDMDADLERGGSSRTPSPGESSSQPTWRHLAALSLSALSGDSILHQPRHARSDRNR
ncbi:hypothetical protein VTO42DRAFT_988 [Malbranchea cinnamomea]